MFNNMLKPAQMSRGLSVVFDSFDQLLRIHLRAVGIAIADVVDIRQDGFGCIGKADGEFVEQESCAAGLVRLEDADQAVGLIFLAKRFEGGADFGGVVAVVVDDDGVVEFADFGHAAIDAGEGADGVGGALGVDADGVAGGDGHGGVDEIVFTGDGELDGGDEFSFVEDFTAGATVGNA